MGLQAHTPVHTGKSAQAETAKSSVLVQGLGIANTNAPHFPTQLGGFPKMLPSTARCLHHVKKDVKGICQIHVQASPKIAALDTSLPHLP